MSTGARADGGAGLSQGSHHPVLRARPPALLQVGPGESATRAAARAEVGGGGGTRGSRRTRTEGAGPSPAPGGLGAECGGSPAGEARGEGSGRSGGRGQGSARRRRRALGGAEGARRARAGQGPGRRAGGRRGSSARGAAEVRRLPAVRLAAARASRTREGEPGPAPAWRERVSARRLCAGEGRAGAPCGSQRGRRGHPAGAGAEEGAWARASATRDVPPPGAFGREARGKEGPGGPAPSEGSVRGAVQGPRVEGGPRLRSDAGCGSGVRKGREARPPGRVCDSPPRPLRPREAGAAPCRPGRGAALAGPPFAGGELKERPGWNLGSRPAARWARTSFVTLGRSLHLFGPQFAHLSNAGPASPTLREMRGM